jgi:hypothetical protein
VLPPVVLLGVVVAFSPVFAPPDPVMSPGGAEVVPVVLELLLSFSPVIMAITSEITGVDAGAASDLAPAGPATGCQTAQSGARDPGATGQKPQPSDEEAEVVSGSGDSGRGVVCVAFGDEFMPPVDPADEPADPPLAPPPEPPPP